MSAAQEFSSPEINEDDYYKRLGAPPSADASEIGNHTKKYVAEFKPELSSHENADERWKRFNSARQTLNSSETKENYDTFRERFGAKQASEAYETWQANDALGDPDSVSAHDLGLEPEVDESESRSRRRSRDRDRSDRRSSGRQRRSSRQERQNERRQRREAGETDIDTDSSKTYSTRATNHAEDSNTDAAAESKADGSESKTSGSGTFGRVIDRVRSTVDLAATEASTMLSLLDLVVVGYLLYFLLVELALGSVPSQAVRNAGTALVGIAVIGGLSWEYLERFEDRLTTGDTTSIGNHFARANKPARLLALPLVSAVLWGVVLLGGGGALTILLLAVSIVSLYGRLRGIGRVVDLPAWTRYIEPGAGVLGAIGFVALFVQSGRVPGAGGPLATADAPVLAGVGVVLLVLVGAPVVAVGRQLTE